MRKAQGSLEYLIIVAAILAIAAIAILFLTGSFGGTKDVADLSICKNAASKCSVEWATTTNPPCTYCEEECPEPLWDECKAGETTQIVPPECKIDSECSDGDGCTADQCISGYCENSISITTCIDNDGCCPAGCEINNDNNCQHGELLKNGDFASGVNNWVVYASHGNCPNVLNKDITNKQMALLQGGNCYNDSGICLGSNQNKEHIEQIVDVSLLDENQKNSLVLNFSSYINGSTYGYSCGGTYGTCTINSCYRNYLQLEYLNSVNTVLGNTYFYQNHYANLTEGDPNLCGVNTDKWFNITSIDSWNNFSFTILQVKPTIPISKVSKIKILGYGYKVAGGPCSYPYVPYQYYSSASRFYLDNLSLYLP